ncbi:hypothetical protein HT165_004733 [Salmonella enterica]|nr:hypothetical protein [Salmonella enterica]
METLWELNKHLPVRIQTDNSSEFSLKAWINSRISMALQSTFPGKADRRPVY